MVLNRERKSGFEFTFTPEDFWFTRKGDKLYVISFFYPVEKALVKSLVASEVGKIKSVRMLGNPSPVSWKQTEAGLEFTLGGTQDQSLWLCPGG